MLLKVCKDNHFFINKWPLYTMLVIDLKIK